MARFDLSDAEWALISPLLPNKPRGMPRQDDRRILNGIFFILRTGYRGATCPSDMGPYTTVYNRFNRWSTKIHAIVDAAGLPVRLLLTPGQASDKTTFSALIDGLRLARHVVADRGFFARAIIELIEANGATAHMWFGPSDEVTTVCREASC